MSTIEWQSAYEIGIPKIDEQHKQLIALMNQLADPVDSEAGKDLIEEVLLDLMKYVRSHFATEELLMAENRYSEIDRHADLHMDFTLRVASMYRSHQQGPKLEPEVVLSFLKNYLIKHILREDNKLRELTGSNLVS